MTKTLVVPLDGSRFAERAVPIAIELSQRLPADVELMTTESKGRRAGERYLDRVAAQHPNVDLRRHVVPFDDAPTAIVYAALEVADGTVCMTSHGRGGLRWAALGSVAEEAVRRLDRPTVLIGRHCKPGRGEPRELVVCWDGTAHSLASFDAACTWAKALDLDLHFLRIGYPIDMTTRDHYDAAVEAAVVAAQADGLKVHRTMLVDAYVAGRISDFAASRPVAMIAMATHARTGIERLGLSSVTMGVVGSAPCPVLVTRAAD
jgi:nucleotide-binding universal stress UspA family protein